MSYIAKHLLWLRDKEGNRVEVPPRRRLPGWVGDKDIADLLKAGAVEQERITLSSLSVQPGGVSEGAIADAAYAPVAGAAITADDAQEAENASFSAAADALGKGVEYQDGKATVKADAAPADEPSPAPAKTAKKGK